MQRLIRLFSKRTSAVLPVFLLGFLTIQAQTVPSPQQTDQIITDPNGNNKADPGDKIRYKVTIQNTGGSTATGTTFNAVPDAKTTFVPGSFRSSPLALPDAYACTGNVGISVPDGASDLLANDFDDAPGGLTTAPGTFATTQGGSITIAANGSFTYTPPAGFTGNDTYAYTLHDSNPVMGVPATDLGTVTFSVSNMIWFVDNTGGGSGGAGTLSNPFKTLADFNASSGPQAGHLVFVKHTGTNYDSGIVLKDNMTLFGSGHTGGANLANVLPFGLAPNSLALPAINGTRPVIQNAGGDGVTLASGNTLRGFNVGNCLDFGMENSGTNSVGNLVVSEVNINNTTGGGFDASHGSSAGMNAVFGSISTTGGVNGINLTGCAGAFTVNGGTITNATGAGVLISGGTVTFSSSGAIATNAGLAVDVDNHDSANGVTFSGNITSTSGGGIRVQNCGAGTKLFSGVSLSLNTGANAGVTLTSNTGATINFTGGGLVITTASGAGFSATGGGTVTVQGAGNTINSTSATALNVANTTIGASGLTFQSISCGNNTAAADPTKAIILNTTGSSGGLTVTGTGATDGSGGTIQFIGERGADIQSAINITLKNMNFTNANNVSDSGGAGTCDNTANNLSCHGALYLRNLTNVELNNLNVFNTVEQGLNGNNIQTLTITGCRFSNCGNEQFEGGVKLRELYGTCAITNSEFDDAFDENVEIFNTTTSNALTLNVTGSTFRDNFDNANGQKGIYVLLENTAGTPNTVNIDSCFFRRLKTQGATIHARGGATNINITNSEFNKDTKKFMAGVEIVSSNSAVANINILGNNLPGMAGGSAILVQGNNNSTFQARINSNTIVGPNSCSDCVLAGEFETASCNCYGDGIVVWATNNSSGKVEIMTNNISGIDYSGRGVYVLARNEADLNAKVTNNTISVAGDAWFAIDAFCGPTDATKSSLLCAQVANNATSISGAGPQTFFAHFRARASNAGSTVNLQGLGANITDYWNNNSNTPGTGSGGIVTSSASGGGVVAFGQTCSLALSHPSALMVTEDQ